MTNYTKLTAFDTKDALSTGDPLKRVKGTELDDEFDAISTAVATKADISSPTFTGTTTVATLAVSGSATVTGNATVSGNATVAGDATVSGTLNLAGSAVFEGATADAFETTVGVTDPTADRSIVFPDKSGTVALTSDIDITDIVSTSGTYAVSSSTTVTVSVTGHGRAVGDLVYLHFTSGTAVSSEFTVTSVTNANTYTVTYGSSITASGNVTQYYSGLGQIRLASTAEILVGTNTTKAISPYAYQTSKFGNVTAVASTSGTAINFTSIPSWVKRITVMLSGVSGSGTSAFLLRLGTSSGIDSTGYVSTNAYLYSNPVMTTSTSGFLLTGANAATDTVFGQFVISNITDNNWVGNGSMARAVGDYLQVSSGGVTLDGELTQLRITTVNGTDTFDAGSVNVLYE